MVALSYLKVRVTVLRKILVEWYFVGVFITTNTNIFSPMILEIRKKMASRVLW